MRNCINRTIAALLFSGFCMVVSAKDSYPPYPGRKGPGPLPENGK
jgi:hypothetical protein